MRELSRVDVRRVSGGLGHIGTGALVGGVVGGVGYYAGTCNVTPGGMATAVVTGAATGALAAGTVFWGSKALGATFKTAQNRMGVRSAKFGAALGVGGYGGGMAMMGTSGPSAQSQSCMGKGGGSW